MSSATAGLAALLLSAGSGAVSGDARVAPGVLPAGQTDDSWVVSCEVGRDASSRTYRLSRPAPGADWSLAVRHGAESPWIRLTLPGAAPAITAGSATLRYRSGTGGRIVNLSIADGVGSLDVYVSYELEVNVEPDMRPEVDELNTGGVVDEAACRIERAVPAPRRGV